MLFDFEKFARIAASVFPGGPYSLEETLKVFFFYFERYEAYTGEAHPPIKASQIVKLSRLMPYLYAEDIGLNCCEIEPYQYPDIIRRHFETRYRNCDYNINHFFSGTIRELRLCEALH